MSRLAVVCLVIVGACVLVSSSAAEVPNRSPQWMKERASHVVVGEIVAVYSRESREGPWKYTRYVAEIRISEIEKGDGLVPESVVFARYFQREYKGPGRITDTSGYRDLAREGDRVRVYLARNTSDGFNRENADGGFNLMFPNGFEQMNKLQP